jgi:HEAT repeat protein
MSGLVCGLTLLLAAAPLRAQTPQEVGPETRQALRAAKTVRLEVQQEYDLSGENAEGEEAKADEPKAKAGPPKKFSLPLEELAAGMLKLTGWKLAPAGARADVTLTIDVRGTPLGADYVGTVMGRHYTGAELTGSARLALGDQVVTEADISAKIPVATTIRNSYYRPSDAPFSQTLPHYCEALFTVIGRVCGPGPVVAGLKLENFDQQTGAGRALLAVGDASIEPALIEILGQDKETLARVAALGLGVHGRATALPPLLAALRKDKSGATRTNYTDPFDDELLRTLTVEPDQALPPTERAGAAREKLDDYGTMHRAVEWALLQIEAPDKLGQLTAALQSPDSIMLRRGAAVVLGEMADQRAFAPLAAATRDKDPLVRAAAVAALGRLKDERSVEVFLAASTDSADYVSKLAREQLAVAGEERWKNFLQSTAPAAATWREIPVRVLLDGFAHSDPLVRAAAAKATSDRPEKEIKTGLAALLRSDSQAFVREVVVESLAEARDDDNASILALALGDADAATRRAAVQGLKGDAEGGDDPERKAARSRLPETALGPLLVLVARDELDAESAASLLGRIEGPAVADALLHVLEKERPPVVAGLIARRLAELGDKRVVPPLLTMLAKAREEDSTQFIVDALVKLGDPAILEPLIAQLKSGTPMARRLAINVLGRLRQPRAIGPLIAVLRAGETARPGEPAERQAGVANEALETLTGKSFGKSDEWLRWWKENAGKPFVLPPPKAPKQN